MSVQLRKSEFPGGAWPTREQQLRGIRSGRARRQNWAKARSEAEDGDKWPFRILEEEERMIAEGLSLRGYAGEDPKDMCRDCYVAWWADPSAQCLPYHHGTWGHGDTAKLPPLNEMLAKAEIERKKREEAARAPQ